MAAQLETEKAALLQKKRLQQEERKQKQEELDCILQENKRKVSPRAHDISPSHHHLSVRTAPAPKEDLKSLLRAFATEDRTTEKHEKMEVIILSIYCLMNEKTAKMYSDICMDLLSGCRQSS